jgi:hypothetical protein
MTQIRAIIMKQITASRWNVIYKPEWQNTIAKKLRLASKVAFQNNTRFK